MQPCVLGLVDNTHTSAAQFLDDAVVGDGLADHIRPIMNIEVPSYEGG
jgi:hypothetical protein